MTHRRNRCQPDQRSVSAALPEDDHHGGYRRSSPSVASRAGKTDQHGCAQLKIMQLVVA
jgi:hypothetical protein